MKRRILLVDDEVAVLLTLKAVLEISGFDVDTATSAREGKSRIKHREYEMIITDMRMEGEEAGREVIAAAKEAPYAPAVALLTAFPVDDDAVDALGADKMLVKPMHTRVLLQQLETLFARHVAAREKATKKVAAKAAPTAKQPAKKTAKGVKKAATVDAAVTKLTGTAVKSAVSRPAAKKSTVGKPAVKKPVPSKAPTRSK